MENKEVKKREIRDPYMWEIVVILAILIVVLSFSLLVLGVEAHIPFVVVIALTSLMAIRMGHTWADLEKKILDSIASIFQAVIILMMVGMVIGSWIQGGIVPSLIYYGLELINPNIFLVTIFVVMSICSVATGSSWTIVGTLGVAAMGIGEGLGIPAPITAGAAVGAGYFGDKFSPLSDTPNLHCAICRVNLFDNFKNILKTTIPMYIVAVILTAIVGMRYSASDRVSMESIETITTTLDETFVISPLLILPVLMVVAMIVFKIPAIPGIFLMALVGALCGVFVQGADLGSVITSIHTGYVGNTGVESVDSLLTRGGLSSMLGTASLIFCAISYGGVLEATGTLRILIGKILGIVKKDGSLIFTTIVSSIILNMIAVDNYVTAVITGNMFRKAYIQRGLHPLNLSKCLAESAAITSPLIPWNTCGIVMFGMIGVSAAEYLPYAFMCWVPPIMLTIFGYLNIGIIRLTPEEQKALLEEDA
uniref:Na+/H+ antiporter NhaC n=1 Tax=Lachnoclostridium phocaeense TaxID=1871021 RepID=UPI0026DBD13E|nr:Na+/H+ antiporter NhaC [Lachnoclostridium phocaeense]